MKKLILITLFFYSALLIAGDGSGMGGADMTASTVSWSQDEFKGLEKTNPLAFKDLLELDKKPLFFNFERNFKGNGIMGGLVGRL